MGGKRLGRQPIGTSARKIAGAPAGLPECLRVRIQAVHLYMRQEKYLPAIGLLVPLSRELEKEKGKVNDFLYSQVWALLALCYSGIQSWALAIDAFRKAGESNPEIHALKIPYLHSAVRSSHVLLGSIHQELGDAYSALNDDVKAKEMYNKALIYDSGLSPPNCVWSIWGNANSHLKNR
ncbi:hypothetical protein CULT_160058 [[Clostridium] ultunense Esp]|nr:hypothetical protein CULT_160058 [[Clostridium] ultunense Esp]